MNLSALGNRQAHTLSSSTHHIHRHPEKQDQVTLRNSDDKWGTAAPGHGSSQAMLVQTVPTENNNVAKFAAPLDNLQPPKDGKDLPTPSSTPTTSRKTRRRSNLFTPSKKGDDKLKNGELGSGRAIPLKQGYLYKRSSKALNKEWKKKYVTLCDDGRLTYHPSLHVSSFHTFFFGQNHTFLPFQDYMDDSHGKEISLQYVTVKVPGQKPRGSKSIITVAGSNGSASINEGLGGLSLSGYQSKDKRLTDRVLLTAFDVMKDPGTKYNQQASSDEGMVLSNSNSFLNGDSKTETPNVKKRHRRMKSSGLKNSEYDGKQFVTTPLPRNSLIFFFRR